MARAATTTAAVRPAENNVWFSVVSRLWPLENAEPRLSVLSRRSPRTSPMAGHRFLRVSGPLRYLVGLRFARV